MRNDDHEISLFRVMEILPYAHVATGNRQIST